MAIKRILQEELRLLLERERLSKIKQFQEWEREQWEQRILAKLHLEEMERIEPHKLVL